MNIDTAMARTYLRTFNFRDLFVEVLGWENPPSRRPIDVAVEGVNYRLVPVADKRGMAVFCCEPDADGLIPIYDTRRKIDKALTERAYEHIVVYVDAAGSEQRWQWVKREPGKP